jgi:hypothetical protein
MRRTLHLVAYDLNDARLYPLPEDVQITGSAAM